MPAYVVSLILLVSYQAIDAFWFGSLLKLVPLIGLGFAIYFGGAQQGWG